jgi:hypothetical protein
MLARFTLKHQATFFLVFLDYVLLWVKNIKAAWELFLVASSVGLIIPIKKIKYLSVLRQVNSLFQTEFSKVCDLELPPSTSSIFLFP